MKRNYALKMAICCLLVLVMTFSGCTSVIVGPKVNSNEKEIWEFLYEKIGNPYGVAGLMANLNAESNLKPNNLQNSFEKKLGMSDDDYTKAVDDGTYDNFVRDSAGYGLAQWTFWSRKQGLLEFAKQKGTSVGDLQMQLEYLWQELQRYKSVMEVLRTAEDVQTASDKVLIDFERPASASDYVKNARASVAQTFFERYGEAYV